MTSRWANGDHKVYTRPTNVRCGGSTAPVRERSGTSGPHIGLCGDFGMRVWVANETAGGVAMLLRRTRWPAGAEI